MSEDRPILIRRDCLALVEGDLVVAALLSQIVYWSLPGKGGKSKLTVKRFGHFWIAKTRDVWMEETGLTIDQYKRAISVLKEKQLVEVRIMKFFGNAMSHIRLRQSIAGVVVRPSGEEPANTVGGKPPSTAQVNSPQLAGGKPPVLIVHRLQTETNPSDHWRGCSPRVLTAEGTPIKCSREGEDPEGKDPEKNKSTEKEQKKGQEGMKASDILKAHSAPLKGGLGGYWQARVHTATGEWQKPLTQKELGQLSQLKKKLGYDDARKVITFVTDAWWKFTSIAKATTGTSAPVTPQIGYLLKNYDVAVNLLMVKAAGPPKVPEAPPVQLIATTGTPEVPHALSSQELTELLTTLKAP